MSESTLPATGSEREVQQSVVQSQAAQPKRLDALHTEKGDTTIADQVVAKLAGIAAREVPGVWAMGNAARRVFNTITERIPGSQTNVSGGVSVEKGERQAAIDVSIVIDYGASVIEVSEAIRRNIINAVESLTGLEVLEVNVNITDVHLPEDDVDTTDVVAVPSARLE